MSLLLVLMIGVTFAAICEAVVERRRRKRAAELDLQRRLRQLKG